MRHPQTANQLRQTAQLWLEASFASGATIACWDDGHYPRLLRTLNDPPPVLFWQGSWPEHDLWARSLAIVGTRSCTPLGSTWAREVGREWAEAGGMVVSGLARGIDGQAHRGVLQSHSPHAQVAVLPCSLAQIYPKMHAELANEVVDAGGLLLSEQPPGRPVERWMFASRNRILAGMSPTMLVVQSPASGGSLISAQCAWELDRELYVMYRPDMDRMWSGNRALVADQWATPVHDVEHLWANMACGPQDPAKKVDHPGGLPEECRAVWMCLHARCKTTRSQLQERLSLQDKELTIQLFTLEVQGWIRRVPGGGYLRA